MLSDRSSCTCSWRGKKEEHRRRLVAISPLLRPMASLVITTIMSGDAHSYSVVAFAKLKEGRVVSRRKKLQSKRRAAGRREGERGGGGAGRVINIGPV